VRAVPTRDGAGLRVLAVDDEPPALDELAFLLGRDERVSEVLTCGSATDALRILRGEPVDVVLLDVAMPGLSGLELAQVLRQFRRPPAVIFVTAHQHHAVEAFDLHAVDYLLKPVREERLREAVRRVTEEAGPPDPDEQVPVELGGVTRFVRRSDVRYATAQGDYVRAGTRGGGAARIRAAERGRRGRRAAGEPAARARRPQPAPACSRGPAVSTSADDEPAARVRITSPRTSSARSRARRSSAAEIDELTRLGEVYVQSLMRAQLRLAAYVVVLLAATIGVLPVLFRLPPVARLHLLGVPLPWLLLGAGVYPWLLWLAWFYVRRAEHNEAAFEDLVEGRDPV
jgi:CheY-like chemotaxis protein